MKKTIKNKQVGLRNRLVFIVFGIFVVVGIITYSIVFLVSNTDLFYYIEFNLSFSFVLALTLSLVIGTAITSLVGKQILTPMMKLNYASKEIANGNFHVKMNADTQIKEIEEIFTSFNQMVAELKNIEMMRNDFVANISHEFKTPLTAIEGYATLLQDNELEDDERLQYIQTILDSTKQLSTLSSNILRLSKLENQDKVTDKTLYRLDEQIRQVLLYFEKTWLDKELELILDLPKTMFYQNENLLMQVWINLLSNAIKFTPPLGSIQVILIKRETEIIVSIKDSGIGMTQQVKKHIFEKFYQGDRSRSKEGNGLGLALVYRIVCLCNGKIQVNSEPDKGSEFIVTFSTDKSS
ncbi:sensor histidine kinase [Paenibacillus maysiensis]|uniref:sensor histidine kinase n=1 Tax=Paenibacillus maysiensis TaxID=1155954 RepID=UPI0004B2E7E6|nr:HAMP domain-containing sensor histidine kinase [Paenibacillus maysiensis]